MAIFQLLQEQEEKVVVIIGYILTNKSNNYEIKKQ